MNEPGDLGGTDLDAEQVKVGEKDHHRGMPACLDGDVDGGGVFAAPRVSRMLKKVVKPHMPSANQQWQNWLVV